MDVRKRIFCLCFIVCCVFVLRGYGGTVFVAERRLHRINAYPVENDAFGLPMVIDYGHDESNWGKDPVYGLGPIDVTVDEDHNILFVSFESRSSDGEPIANPHILLMHSRTLEILDTVQISFARDIGGLHYHPGKRKLYGVERNSSRIFQMKWDPESITLELEKIFELSNMEYASALVMNGDHAFVSEYQYGETMEYTKHIKEYDASGGDDWSFVRTIAMGAETTCLGYDTQREIFYSGAYDFYNTYHHFIKHVMDPNHTTIKDIGHTIIDADVDEVSGYVYATGYLGGGWSEPNAILELWDTSGWADDPGQVIEPLDSTKVSIAGPAGVLYLEDEPRPPNIRVSKNDDVNDDPNFVTCILPGQEIVYTITVDPNRVDHQWMRVVDYLPRGVTYDYVLSINPLVVDPNYDPDTHTYTWNLGPLNANDPPVILTLRVTVNGAAQPLGELVNYVAVESDVAFDDVYFKTPVCLYGGDEIYVDEQAPAGGNGTSWELAYQSLVDGLDRALEMKELDSGVACKVYVADGMYKPPTDVTESFVVVEDASVYGGYVGYGSTDPNLRDPDKYKTILSGFIGYDSAGNEKRNETVVEMQDNTLLDGCTVEKGDQVNIQGFNSSYSLFNCTLKENTEIGVACEFGDLSIHWCEIENNGYEGIYHRGSGYTLSIENCSIHYNQHNGILTTLSNSEVLNTEIAFNGSGDNYYGINIGNPSSSPIIRNCTIVYNANEGIRYTGIAQNKPDVRSCILFANNADENYIDYFDYHNTWYCCLTDPNNMDAPLPEPPTDSRENMKTHPGFAYPGPAYRNFHLAEDSPCVNAGDSNPVGSSETDLDGDDRDGDAFVDIGADEVNCWEEIGDPNDFNGDGVINYEEFNLFARVFLKHDPNDPAITIDPNDIGQPNYIDPNRVADWYPWGPIFDKDADYDVDLADLEEFIDNWLWVACWRQDLQNLSSMMMGSGGDNMMMSMPAISESLESSQALQTEPDPANLEQNILLILEEIEKMKSIYNAETVEELQVYLKNVLNDLKQE